MHFPSPTSLLLLSLPFAAVANAAVIARAQTSDLAGAIKQIAPKSATEPCTDDPQAPGQCRGASKAADAIQKSLNKYNVNNKAEIAAVISLMALESGEFQFQKNVFPGRPGQGSMFITIIPYHLHENQKP